MTYEREKLLPDKQQKKTSAHVEPVRAVFRADMF